MDKNISINDCHAVLKPDAADLDVEKCAIARKYKVASIYVKPSMWVSTSTEKILVDQYSARLSHGTTTTRGLGGNPQKH